MSDSDRPHLYSNVHKAIRSMLGELVIAVGRTDFTTGSEVCALRARFDAVVVLLEVHAHKEDVFILPLLREHAPALAQELDSAHHAQHQQLATLVAELAAIAAAPSANVQARANRFGVALARIVGELFTHMSDEEERAMPALWDKMDDLAILEVEHRLIGSTPPEQLDQWLVIMFPALSPNERAEMLAGVRASAPAPVFDGMLKLISRVLPPRDFARLTHALGERSAA